MKHQKIDVFDKIWTSKLDYSTSRQILMRNRYTLFFEICDDFSTRVQIFLIMIGPVKFVVINAYFGIGLSDA